MEKDKEKESRRTSTLAALTSSSSSSKPPLSHPSTSHLDPNAYVRGTHQITLGNQVVVHPRSHVYSDQGPITIEDRCLISEKCVIGAPASESQDATTSLDAETKTIQIGTASHLHPAVTIHAPCRIASYVVLESNVTLMSNVIVGMHSKICANVTIAADTVIPDFTVVYGDSESGLRRRRIRTGENSLVNVAEEGRLNVFEKEREGALVLLRQTAARGLSAGGGGSRRGK